MRKILKRKLLSAYFSSLAVIMLFVTTSWVHAEPGPHLFNNAWGILFIVLLYVTPVMFIYGIAASSFIEFLMGRWSIPTSASILAALIAHMLFGSLLGIVFRAMEAGLLGAICAGTFYILDRLIFYFWSKKPKLSYAAGAFPIILIGGAILYFYIITPPLPPFTAEEAVHFATSGKGTIIDNYPKELGKLSLVTNGYNIERETAVNEIQKDKYEVSFIERWTKDGKTGQRTSNYTVNRESSGGISMGAHGGGGDEPAFTNISIDHVKRAFNAEKVHYMEQQVPSEPKKSIVFNQMAPAAIFKMNDERLITIYVYDSFEQMEKGQQEFKQEQSQNTANGSWASARNVLFLYETLTSTEQHAINQLK